jgi:transaldolase
MDTISRAMLRTGELRRLIEEDGVVGVTSNPTIFQKAISESAGYDDEVAALARADKTAAEIFFALAVQDLQAAADLLRPVYDRTNGADGYVSFEVAPGLAYNTEGTMAAVAKAWQALNRPNVLVKIPATDAGLPAIEACLAQGININITLLFARAYYDRVREAYLRGLERRAAAGQPVDRIHSVASFFVSRVDTLVDKHLEALGTPVARALMGKAAVANARLAYQDFKQTFQGRRWQALAARGANRQRPLWASTSTKNPTYRDVLYVEELIGPQTVNTMPPQTLAAFKDHGVAQPTLESGLDEAEAVFDRLAQLGIDMQAVTDQLQAEGVKAFADSYDALIEAIDRKSPALAAAR